MNATIRKIRHRAEGQSRATPLRADRHGRGYRFIAPVVEVTPPIVEAAAVEEPAAATENLAGKKVSHYRILQVLGGGGMGVVYKAEDLKLGRKVAVKFLPAEMAGDTKAFERLEREARAASALEHPNICPNLRARGTRGATIYRNALLEAKLSRKRLKAQASRRSCPRTSARGGAPNCHRTRSSTRQEHHPSRHQATRQRLLTHRGEVKILDFGLAKIVEQDHATNLLAWKQAALTETSASDAPTSAFTNLRLTRTGTTVGTAHYMSPEQVRSETLDARTDVFSFGLVLYEMATGRRAFPGETAAVVHDAILHQTPPPIHDHNPELSGEFEPIITKAIEKDRSLRYQTTADMRADLTRLKRDLQSAHASVAVSGKATLTRASVAASGKAWKIALPALLVALLVAGGFTIARDIRASASTRRIRSLWPIFEQHGRCHF